MTSDLPYETILQELLKDELKVLNAHLPSQQKSLWDLRSEEYPFVTCKDGTNYLFKKKELEYLAGLLSEEEQKALFLPMLIELSSENEARIISRRGVEEKVVSKVLGMPVTVKEGRVVIYKSQLGELRKVLKTTTQYVFTV